MSNFLKFWITSLSCVWVVCIRKSLTYTYVPKRREYLFLNLQIIDVSSVGKGDFASFCGTQSAIAEWQINAWLRMTMYFQIVPCRADQPSSLFHETGTDVTYLLWHTSLPPVCGLRWLLSLLWRFLPLQDNTTTHGWTLPLLSPLPGMGLPRPITWRSWVCSRRQTPRRGKSAWAVHGVRMCSQVCKGSSRADFLASRFFCTMTEW